MQIQFKSIIFITALIFCGCIIAQSETTQFISLAGSYYEKLTANSAFSSATELAQIRSMLPNMQKALKDEVADQKKHAKALKKDSDATHGAPEEEAVEKARLQLQAAFRESQDISPLKSAIAQAQWILSPQSDRLSKKASIAVSAAADAKAQLSTSEETLDEAWQSQQEN